MTFKLSMIQATAKLRPTGYYDDVVSCGVVVGDSVVLEDSEYERLRIKYGASQSFEGWPAWARLISAKKTPNEAGVGDTVARIIGAFGGDAFKMWFTKKFGELDCGCSERQDRLNAMYPY